MLINEWRPMPRAQIRLPRIGLGTAPLGGLFTRVDQDAAHRTVERAWEANIRYFDTAPLYGTGLSEQRLGHVLGSMDREEYVLSTKVGRLLEANTPGRAHPAGDETVFEMGTDLRPVFDFSRSGVRRSLEESLQRLNLDGVDIAYVHDPDDHMDEALSTALPALAELRADGVVRAIGAGMNQTPALRRLVAEFDCDVILCAGRYTLLDPRAHDDLFPLCRERGTAVVAGGVFNSGILADPRPGTTFDYVPASAELVATAQRIEQHCDHHGVSLAAAALQFVAAHPAVTSVLVGVRSPGEVDAAVEAARTRIPAALWDDLVADGLLRSDLPRPQG